MARRFVGSRVPRTRRLTAWSASAVVTGPTALAGSANLLVATFAPNVVRQTIVRIRGLWGYASDQISADETQIVSLGIAVVEEPAATIGITAVPVPGADASSEAWMYHSWNASNFTFITGVGFDAVGRFHNTVIDSKSMRKLQDNQRIVIVAQNQTANGIDIFATIRILSKLS